MAPKLPERYETRIRLGRDGDVEEWLASDSSLDRPVLVRVLDAGAAASRRAAFIDAVRSAAAAHHGGLAEVYAVGTTQNPYAVLEWHGGVSIADRLRAGETLTVPEFLSIGPRLASGLAELHETGSVHGAIDTGAIGFAGGQPAKIGAFGRKSRYDRPRDDTAALAASLRIAVTGSDIAGIRPSEVAEGLPHGVDDILETAEDGLMSAAALAASLRAQRPTEPAERRSMWSWKWTGVSAGLIAVALVISAVGIAIEVDPESPFLFPAVPADSIAPAPTVGAPLPPAASDALVAEASGYHTGSGEFANEADLPMIVDDARSTSWRSAVYSSPEGVPGAGMGLTFTVAGTPRFVEIAATTGTRYELKWAPGIPGDDSGWERLSSGTVLEGVNLVRIPERDGGRWLLWLLEFPEREAGRFYADIHSVRFLP